MSSFRDSLNTTSDDELVASNGDSGSVARRQTNPYMPGRPVDEKDLFCGRAHEMGTMLSLLRTLNSISVIGPRRIGKTSLLRTIALSSTLAGEGLGPSDLAFVFLSCAEFIDLSQEQILQVKLDRARTAVQLPGVQFDDVDSSAVGLTFTDFAAKLENLTKSGPSVVFLLDEFEYLAKNRHLDPSFFAGLRSVASNLNVAYVTASVANLLDLTYADRSVLGSPFFNIFSTITLGLIDDSEAQTLVNRPSNASGIDFSSETIELIFSLADHHPYFLQVACFHAFEIQSRHGAMNEPEFELLRKLVENDLENHFKSVWYHLNSEERQVFASLNQIQDSKRSQVLLETLADQALIRLQGTQWTPLCKPWKDFVAAQTVPNDLPPLGAADLAPSPQLTNTGDADECVLSVHLTAGPPTQISVDLEEKGELSYVSEKPGTWDVTEDEIEHLYQTFNNLILREGEDWYVDAKDLGYKLYQAIVDGQREVHDAFILGISRHEPHDVHIRFMTPRTYLQLPLELLHDGRDWLAIKHPLSKYITGQRAKTSSLSTLLRPGAEVRALLVGADVSGKVSIDGRSLELTDLPAVEYELDEVRSALEHGARTMGVRFLCQTLRGPEATLQRFRQALAEDRYDLIHYSGHAMHNRSQPDNSALFFWEDSDADSPIAMTVGETKSLLENSDARFVYFSCCAGAGQVEPTALEHDNFLGIIDAAVQAGVPAVLGMRWPIADQVARSFARAFYTTLLPLGDFDSALLAARQSIRRDDLTWISPLLVVQA